jgi:hypothetical protein
VKIDIEKLLQWAVRDELPKGRPVSADIGFAIGHASRPFSMARNLGRAPREIDSLGFVPGEPHADAVVVSAAIARLDTEARFDDPDEVLPLFGNLAAIAGASVTDIMSAKFNPQALVVNMAARGTRPEWNFAHPVPRRRFVPTKTKPRPLVHGIDGDGDVVEMMKNEGRARKRDGEYTLGMSPRSPIEWCDPSPLKVADARAEYVAWHSALIALAGDLAGKLSSFEPTLPAAPARPWLGTLPPPLQRESRIAA